MKILLILMLVFAGFILGADAQVCGQYRTTLIVKTEDNKAVENSVVQLVALGKDETKNKTFVRDENDNSKFSIDFYEGHLVLGKYKVMVSADGFETAEKEIGFPHCKHQAFEIKLKTAKAENQAVLTGIVADENGAVIPKIKVVLTKYYKKSFSAITNEDGYYNLQVPAGVYLIEFVGSSGFLTTKVENYKIAPTKMSLDVILDVDMESSTTIYSELLCEPSKEKKEELNCRYGSRKGNGTSKPSIVTFQTEKRNKN